jgi:hypothetical protein
MLRKLLRLAAGAIALTTTALYAPQADAKFVFPYNHPDLDWFSIETEHFVVHYPVSKKTAEEGNDHYLTGEFSARKIATVSEDMWEPMCSQFNYYLKERIHIVLLNQSDNLEGFTIPPWDWIEISANPGGTFYRSRGRMEWFSDVMVHEFAHVVSLKANATHSEGVQGVLMGGLYQDGIRDMETGVEGFIFDGDSVFWTEGGAEYWSDNAGWNWWTASRDQNIRMTVLDDRLLTYDEWHTRSAKYGWNDSERYYQQGYSFGQYLRQRFGEKTYASFALEYGRRWRPAWESVIETVLGIDAEELYWDWREYVTERYTTQAESVRTRGEVVGHELVNGYHDWDFKDPDARDEYLAQDRYDREKPREASGRYQWEPRVSPDGGYWGSLNFATVVIHKADDDQIFGLTGQGMSDPGRSEQTQLLSSSVSADFEHGWDFVPGTEGSEQAVVVTGREDEHPRKVVLKNFRVETDGYNWTQLYKWELPIREDKVGNRVVETREKKHVGRHQVNPEGSWEQIPNTFRGSDPSVSPDGKRIAYFEYTDGTMNLVNIALDGSDKRLLTHYDDGTWLQTVDWSPDSKKLVFGIFRNTMQNLYTINADGSDLTPLTWDQWEELDAHWSPDGHIYYSAEPDGIFNIYRYNVASGDVQQVTNVISGASSPQVTNDGNLLYSHFSAFGWKVYGLRGEEFMLAPADHLFRTGDEIPTEEVAADMAYAEDLSYWAESTHKYRPFRSLIAPTAVPMFRLENDTMTNWGLQGGFQVFIQDYVEKNGGFIMALLGEDPFVLGQYFYQGWYPNLFIMGYHAQTKTDRGFLLDEDQDPSTTEDQSIYENKQHQYSTVGIASIDYPWNSAFGTSVYGRAIDFGFKGVADGTFDRYMSEGELGMNANWSTGYARGSRGANAAGRNVDLSLNHAWTNIVFEDYGGVITDDGEELSRYQYNKIELMWVENLPIPTFGSKLLEGWSKKRHTIQVDFRAGLVDRNVSVQDEFRAGGQHPYFFGNGNLRPNTQFAGYPGFSLSGETMGMLNLQYRFPIKENFVKRVGPLTTYGVFAQFGGTAGNLWSFRPPEDESLFYRNRYGDRIAYNPDDVRREIPFVDDAYKNGNPMLFDVSAEIRVQSVMFHGAGWDSFVRVAYGFQEVRGYGDVDGDSIFDTNDNTIGDELSSETELPGPRVYIGLGTGW